MKILIDAPGAGEWVLDRAGGCFRPGYDHSFTSHTADGQILGGFVLDGFLGGAIMMHAAGGGSRWCSRELLWLAFHYAFEQLGCYKVLAPVRSDNKDALLLALRIGGTIETTLMDAVKPGVHLVILSITKPACQWLNHAPRQWRDGRRAA